MNDEKATYFIENVLLGTEIPPIVLFDNGKTNKVIDGRQGYETLERFLNNNLELQLEELYSLKGLYGQSYEALSEKYKYAFKDTKIRIIQYSIVNEPKLTEEKEDKIKKKYLKDTIQV